MLRTKIRGTILAATIAAGLATALALAQVQVGSGHALDASLQLGSGGYNSRVTTKSTYYGYTRQYSPRYNNYYNSNRYSNYNAYLGERGYSAGWQRSGYSGSSGSPPGMINTRIDTQINTRIGG